MESPYPLLHAATAEREVVDAVRAYLARLSPVALSAFPGGTIGPLQSGDDVAELALALASRAIGKIRLAVGERGARAGRGFPLARLCPPGPDRVPQARKTAAAHDRRSP
jgi:hypothetical protein